ncbi:MAG TPA: HAD family hydrolase [Pirellulales bacterium]|jgi:HAD superfamily hydrolase (TIGR01549 family)
MTAFIFDLDGTLVDSVYAHVLAWQAALKAAGLEIDGWRIHRRIGLSGALLLQALNRECGCNISSDEAHQIERHHGEQFNQFIGQCRPTRGAVELLAHLRESQIPVGIATSGSRPGIDPLLRSLKLDDSTIVVGGKRVSHGKPEPDEFVACQQKLGVRPEECFVVGDAVWDLLAAGRARMFSIGLLCGGAGAETLFEAGAYRVFEDPAELNDSLYQLGL